MRIVPFKGSCWSKFAHFVSYHVFCNIEVYEILTIMNFEIQTNEVGGNSRSA